MIDITESVIGATKQRAAEQRAADDRITLRDLFDRALRQYPADTPAQAKFKLR